MTGLILVKVTNKTIKTQIQLWLSRMNNEGSQAIVRRQKVGQVNRKLNVKMRTFMQLLVIKVPQ
jgi:hypothetical protein